MTEPQDTCPGAPYTLRVTGRDGGSFYRECADWNEVQKYTGKYRGWLLDLFGDSHDYDWDGLTEQEREMFAELI